MKMVAELSANRFRLKKLVQHLGDLSGDMVFIGGVVAELLQTRPLLPKPRATDDVDAVAAITSRGEYERFADRLRERGFREDSREGAPVCRWVAPNGVSFDVVPIDAGIFGFGNKWDPIALETAEVERIDADTTIRRVSAPVFLAMKFEAFADRGDGDWFASRDVEDIIAVIAGRPEVVDEVRSAREDVREYVPFQCRSLLERDDLEDILAGALSSSAQLYEVVGVVENRLTTLAGS